VNISNNIFLVGLVGSGKTTVGRQLAAELGKTFHDTDQEIERRTGVRIALIFEIDILLERAGAAKLIDHHRVIDDEVAGDERIDLLRVAAGLRHRIAHRGEIDDAGDAGEILHQYGDKSRPCWDTDPLENALLYRRARSAVPRSRGHRRRYRPQAHPPLLQLLPQRERCKLSA
jgi:hypothetical protein